MLADFRRLFSEFLTVDDAVVEEYIDLAKEIHNIRKSATLYCAAHLLSISQDDTSQPDFGAVEVIQETIGPKSVTYRSQLQAQSQTETTREAFFNTSRYGRIFLVLEKRTPSFAMPVRVY